MTPQPSAPFSPVRGMRRDADRPGRTAAGGSIGAPEAESMSVLMDAFLSSTDVDHLVITVRGETDLANAGDLLSRLVLLAGAATGQIALDLSQVTFMDCAGLRTLAEIDRLVTAGGGSVRVASVSPAVARLFELVGSALPWSRVQEVPFARADCV